MDELTTQFLGLAAMAFVLGGLVKGTLGIGLPLVVVPLLSLFAPTHLAISLVAVPVMASNLWQAHDSKSPLQHARRFAPLWITLMVFTAITVPLTLALNAKTLNVMLAVAVITAIVLMSLNPKLNVSPRHEKIWGVGLGALSGVMGGISSLTGPIIVTFLMALRLTRDEFVGIVSIIYLAGALPLYIAMAVVGRLGWHELGLSLLAMVPVSLGMLVGKRIRVHLSEEVFRRVLLGFLSLIALALLLK